MPICTLRFADLVLRGRVFFLIVTLYTPSLNALTLMLTLRFLARIVLFLVVRVSDDSLHFAAGLVGDGGGADAGGKAGGGTAGGRTATNEASV